MSNLPGRLGTLTARNIMTRSVITLTDSDSVEAAVRELRSQSITGAPVVDDNGIFVGILSLSDLVCRRNPESSDDPPPAASLTDKADAATWELFDSSNPLAEQTNVERVADRMSKNVTSVPDSAPLVEVVRAMCNRHWLAFRLSMASVPCVASFRRWTFWPRWCTRLRNRHESKDEFLGLPEFEGVSMIAACRASWTSTCCRR